MALTDRELVFWLRLMTSRRIAEHPGQCTGYRLPEYEPTPEQVRLREQRWLAHHERLAHRVGAMGARFPSMSTWTPAWVAAIAAR